MNSEISYRNIIYDKIKKNHLSRSPPITKVYTSWGERPINVVNKKKLLQVSLLSKMK